MRQGSDDFENFVQIHIFRQISLGNVKVLGDYYYHHYYYYYYFVSVIKTYFLSNGSGRPLLLQSLAIFDFYAILGERHC